MKASRLAASAVALTAGILGGCGVQRNAAMITIDPPVTVSQRQALTDSICNRSSDAVRCQKQWSWYTDGQTQSLPVAPAAYSLPSLAERPAAQGRTEVVLTRGGGTFGVPVTINGALQLNFTVDSGAAVVLLPADVVLTLRRTGTLRDADTLGKATYTLADGSQISGLRFRIRSLKVGDRVLHDVEGGSAPIAGGLLLGQSFLHRFQSWSIDNARGVLVLE
jgi:aspartyl protease family protein